MVVLSDNSSHPALLWTGCRGVDPAGSPGPGLARQALKCNRFKEDTASEWLAVCVSTYVPSDARVECAHHLALSVAQSKRGQGASFFFHFLKLCSRSALQKHFWL